MRDVVEVLDVIDLAISRGVGVLPAESLDRIERRALQLRDRRGYAGDVLVLGIAGGTGSGKSSLLNAMAGAPIASVSHLRPHTDAPLAWIPETAGTDCDCCSTISTSKSASPRTATRTLL